AVVADRLHRRLLEAARARRPVADGGAQDVVAVDEHVRPDLDLVAERPFGRIVAAVEHRPHPLDLDPCPRLRQSRHRELPYRESAWIGDWERFAGPGAAEDQVRFDREWSTLRRYAAAQGIPLIGDLPIYVAPASADHLAHPELFQRRAVAGAPPDALSAVGQLWGNPLYDWPALRRRGYGWWIERLRRACALFDLSRI